FNTFLVLLVTTVILGLLALKRRMSKELRPFRFMELPPELRDQVYEYLLEDPYFPPPPTNTKNVSLPLNWLPGRRLVALQAQDARPRRSNWLFLANKQVYAEFMDLVCKHTTFHLTVSPANYPKPPPNTAKPVDTATPVQPQPSENNKEAKIWHISPAVLRRIRKCDIKLITTSEMLGVSDPRNMTPASWALSHQIRAQLKDVEKVEELNLHVKALGDPLWNPLWVWYHASQSFKNMGVSREGQGEGGVLGPKLHRITFSLDTWSPGENYLERDQETGQWRWLCMKNHAISADPEAEMPVREFCRRLYEECRVCSPESEGEE
ncbi:hypothetical protein BDV96DRAFT_466564, partial [Lophiotrema nucula]